MANLAVKYRFSLLLLGAISLIIGIFSGLMRLGWPVSFITSAMVANHGALMVGGFLGTVISLERAVALGQKWAYMAPLTAIVSALLLITTHAVFVSAMLMTSASMILSATTLALMRRSFKLHDKILLLGSLSWLIANILWLTSATSVQQSPWWLGFLIFTIAGERLELSRLLPQNKSSKRFFLCYVLIFLMGGTYITLSASYDMRLLSLALLAISLWLLRHDIATHTVKQQGLTRYMGYCLLSGYVWLLVAALIGIFNSPLLPGTSYDAFMHSILLGFVFSMIFAHAPVIFPAVLKVKIPYHPAFYLPLIILHISLMLRVTGDMIATLNLSKLGGAVNAMAIGLFILIIISSVLRGRTA